ncbi:SPX-domain-containing protein [Acrodontium crateriforme]|uniref:SPX-domain-containing protein n=1 Tax=Acrodontium crateriforme TaxID=150365 RepID=A0AAQ3MDR8_9PEZI|nr:SPX-domain-containing protein [Acrodontium crateriforme]
MRFGKTLATAVYPPWKDQYIDYPKLKKLLHDDDSAPSSPANPNDTWTEDDESAFVDELVNVQLEKVHSFHKDTYEALRERTAKCEARLDAIAVADAGTTKDGKEASKPSAKKSDGNGKRAVPSEEEKQKTLKQTLSELDQITSETNELEKYSRINYTGFLKAAKKHDRKRGSAYRVRPLLQVRLAALPFNKEDYSPLLYRLSAMYSFVRQNLEVVGERGMSMSEPRTGLDEYISHKFWVHPENLLEVKTMILRRLPVLVYNPQTSRIAEGSQPDPSITSIYFDNPKFDLYTKKVDHGAATSLRLRWYGQLNDKPDIWVEKKTISEDETSHESRFMTKEKYIQRFINDQYHMEKQIKKLEDRAGSDNAEVKSMSSAVDEIQTFIKEQGLQPMLRANYTRTAFQVPGDDRVRISLDTDLAFIREDSIDERPCRDPESWHRTDIDNNEMTYPFSSIRKGEVTRFPFALLEIKERNSGKKAEWVKDIMSSHLVKEAPRFSKFVHGVAQLFEDYVNTFPFWLSEMETDIRRDPQKAFEEEQAKKQKARDDEFAVGSLLKSRPSYSTMVRSHKSAIISPVGSPAMDTIGDRAMVNQRLSTSLARQTEVHETAGEPDEDETGVRGETSANGGFASFLPSMSNSKYANAKRNKSILPPGVSKPDFWIKDQGPIKVEAKVWLANQRTFIKWQHVSILLATLGLGLYNAAGENNNIARSLALVYTLVAVLTAAWGYGIYMWRVKLIEQRSGKDFDAIAGPIMVCVGLTVALILNFAFKYQAVSHERESHSGHPGLNQTMYSDLRIDL